MTERLYYALPMLASCRARVVSCVPAGGGFEVILDRTVIFPEGGGQPADRGTIGAARVSDAQERDGEVVHIADLPVEAGSEVTVTLDVPRRLDHSQQHTGEHMLSGLASKLFGAKNAGFHMAEDYCTIDLDAYLDRDKLALLEERANEAVRQNLPVTAVVTDEEGLSRMTLRKKSDAAKGEIRVVFIGGGEVDSCTCCGTHCAATGEVGYIRIADSQKYKGGVRLWFSCGGRAVKEAIGLTRLMTDMAASYSTSRGDLPAAVRKQSDELAASKRELKARTKALCDMIAEANAEPAAVMLRDGFSANDVKMLSEALVDGGARVALVFGRRDGATNYRALRANNETLPMNEVVQAVNALLGGKGGGSPAFAQGAAPNEVTPEMLGIMKDYIEKRL